MKKATKLLGPALGVGLVFGAIGVSASETVTVTEGDTYWGIAQAYENVMPNELAQANPYDARAIPVGATLTVPTEDVVTHVVQPGNTLTEIAAAYDGVSVDELLRLNPSIDPYDLTIGSEVVVVDRTSAYGEDYLYHRVQPGNTFYEIASVYDGVSVDDLMHANPNTDPDELIVGTRIVIPLR